MKTIIEWYPIKRTVVRVKEEARETGRVSYSKREVEDKGYVVSYADDKLDIAFRTEQELLKHLTFILTQEGIYIEEFDFIEAKESIGK